MNNNFVLLDKNNNINKNAQMIVKFNLDEIDYLVYSIDENEKNNQIFVSKLILNSEGQYFIDDVSNEEKGKISNIAYNIVVLLPTDMEKGSDFQTLINNLFNKFSVKLLSGLPDFTVQEYYSNSSIAITNKTLVENAIKLYTDKLNSVKENDTPEVPMWTAPVEATAPTPVDNNINNSVEEPVVVSTSIPVDESIVVPKEDLDVQNNEVDLTIKTDEVNTPSVTIPSEPVIPVDTSVNDDVIVPNPQLDKIAIVSDPSLGIGISKESNITDNKKAGFANTKYVIIGSICLVLAVAVIITAYVLISNI